jgi:hypothetical protein
MNDPSALNAKSAMSSITDIAPERSSLIATFKRDC